MHKKIFSKLIFYDAIKTKQSIFSIELLALLYINLNYSIYSIQRKLESTERVGYHYVFDLCAINFSHIYLFNADIDNFIGVLTLSRRHVFTLYARQKVLYLLYNF